MKLSVQQELVLRSLIEWSSQTTEELRSVRVPYWSGPPDGTYPIGPSVSIVLRRLEVRGLVRRKRDLKTSYWSITDEGLAKMGWTR